MNRFFRFAVYLVSYLVIVVLFSDIREGGRSKVIFETAQAAVTGPPAAAACFNSTGSSADDVLQPVPAASVAWSSINLASDANYYLENTLPKLILPQMRRDCPACVIDLNRMNLNNRNATHLVRPIVTNGTPGVDVSYWPYMVAKHQAGATLRVARGNTELVIVFFATATAPGWTDMIRTSVSTMSNVCGGLDAFYMTLFFVVWGWRLYVVVVSLSSSLFALN